MSSISIYAGGGFGQYDIEFMHVTLKTQLLLLRVDSTTYLVFMGWKATTAILSPEYL